MSRAVCSSLAMAVLLTFAACADRPATDPVSPTDDQTLLGKKGPAGCLSADQQALFDEIEDEIPDLFGNGGSRSAARQQLNNIGRKLCEGDYADALDKAFEYLGLIDENFPDLFDGDAEDAGEHASKVFALVAAAPNPADPFDVPPGAFDPETGGIIIFDPDEVTLPFVATTGNNEAAVVLDVPGIFPPGTGEVTIVLSRSAGDLVTTFGAYIPGFQAFEEGYEIISSHQPSDLGPGILVAICGVPPLPEDAPIGHLHEGVVSLLVPTDPDPQELGYIDCSDVDPTTTIPEETFWTSDAGGANPGGPGWVQLARRAVEPVARLLAPPPLNAEMLAVGPGLGGRTKSLSLNAPVDPVIDVDESVELQAGFDATWTSDDEGIATVEGFGDSAIVTGVCPGTTFVTAAFGDESSLSIRITVEGEGGEGCDSELPEPILEQTGFPGASEDVTYELSITNAEDYDEELFTTDSNFGECAETEGDASRLILTIYQVSEGPIELAFFCDITSADDLSTFELFDSSGDYEGTDVFVEIYDQATETFVESNTITLHLFNPDIIVN